MRTNSQRKESFQNASFGAHAQFFFFCSVQSISYDGDDIAELADIRGLCQMELGTDGVR